MSLILPAFSSPELKAFPLCSKSSKSSAGGQGETVSSTSFQPQTRLTLASALWPQWFLVDVCARAGKTLISRSALSASGSCRALRACPLWHLPSVFASAVADAKTAVKHHRSERTDGRFRVGAVVTVVLRPEGMMVLYIYML